MSSYPDERSHSDLQASYSLGMGATRSKVKFRGNAKITPPV
jgi:hypothetical protein